MAVIDNVIKILFEGVDNTSSSIDSVSSGLNKIDQSIQSVAAPIADLGDKIIKLEAAFAALAIGGLAYAFVKATEFESAVVNLDKVLGKEESEQLPALTERMKGFADAYGFTATAAVDSAAEFRKASFDLEASAHLAELSAKLVVGAGEKMFQQGQATASLISILKGFKVAQEDIIPTSTHLGDVLNKLADEYATSVGELANGMTILSPIAGSLGFSMDEMAGFLIPVIEIFRSGSESATGMKTSLLSLSDPTKEVQKEFKKIGVELKDSSGKMKDVKTILADLMPVYSKMSKEQQLMTASMIAGKDQAAKFTALLNGMGTAAKATAIALNEGKDGLGSLNKEVDRGLGTTAVQIQRMEAAFDNLAIAIGTKYKDSWKEAIMGTTEIELALKKLADSGAFNEIFNAVNEFSGEIGRVFKEIAANLPEALANVDFSGLINSVEGLAKDILGLFGNISSSFDTLDFTNAKELTKIIQFAIDSLKSMTEVLRGMTDTWKPFIEGIIDAIKNVDKFGEGGEFQLGRIIGAMQVIVKFGTTMGLVLLEVTQAGYSLSEGFKVLYNSVDFVVQSFQVFSDVIVSKALETLNPLIQAALTAADALTLFGKIPGLEGVHESIQGLKKGFNELTEGAKYSLGQNMEEAAAAGKAVIDGLAGKTDELAQKIAAVPPVNIKLLDPTKIVGDFENIEKKLRELEEKKTDLKLQLTTATGDNVEKIKDELSKVYTEITDLTAKGVALKTVVETAGLEELQGKLDAIELETITLKLDITSPAQDLKWIDERMDVLSKKQVELKLDLKAADGKKAEEIQKEINQLQKTLEDLDTKRFNVVLDAKLEGDVEFLKQIEKYEQERLEIEIGIKPAEDQEDIFRKMSEKFDEELGTKELRIKVDEETTRLGLDKINSELSMLDQYLIELNRKKYDINLEIAYNSADGKNDTPNDMIEDLAWLNAEIDKATKEREAVEIKIDQVKVGSDIEGITEKLVALEKERQIELKPYLSERELQKTFDFIDAEVGGVHYIEYFGAVNKDSVEKTKEELEKQLPIEKQLEIKVKMDLEDLRLKADIVKTQAQELTKQYDIKAKLDIAALEAETKRITAELEAMTKQFESTGDVITSLFSEWDADADIQKIWAIKRQLEDEARMRAESFEMTKQQMELDLELQRLRIQRMEDNKGKAALEVKIDPAIEPALDLVLRYVLQHTRIWGTEYGFSQLLDVPV